MPARIEEYKSRQTLLKQNASDKHVYLIISGEVSIEVNGKRIAISGPVVPIGEMALLDPSGGRSASARDQGRRGAARRTGEVCGARKRVSATLARDRSSVGAPRMPPRRALLGRDSEPPPSITESLLRISR